MHYKSSRKDKITKNGMPIFSFADISKYDTLYLHKYCIGCHMPLSYRIKCRCSLSIQKIIRNVLK